MNIIKHRLGTIDNRLGTIDNRLDTIDANVEAIKSDVEKLNVRLAPALRCRRCRAAAAPQPPAARAPFRVPAWRHPGQVSAILYECLPAAGQHAPVPAPHVPLLTPAAAAAAATALQTTVFPTFQAVLEKIWNLIMRMAAVGAFAVMVLMYLKMAG